MAQQGNNGQPAVNNAPCRNLARICRAQANAASTFRGMAFANLRRAEMAEQELAIIHAREARLGAPRVDLRAVLQQGPAAVAAPPDRPRGALALAVADELRLKLKVLGGQLEKCEAGSIDTAAAAECNNKADGLAEGGAETEEGAATLPTAVELAANLACVNYVKKNAGRATEDCYVCGEAITKADYDAGNVCVSTNCVHALHAECWGDWYHNFLYTNQGARDVMMRPEGGGALQFIHGKDWRSKSAHGGWVSCGLCRGPFHNNESWAAMCQAIDAEQANAPEGAVADISGPEGELRALVVEKQEQFIVYLTGAHSDKAVLVPGAVAGLSGEQGQISKEKPTFHATLRSTVDSVHKRDGSGERLFQWDGSGEAVGGCGRWCLIADLPEWARDLPVPPESKLTTTKPSEENAAQGKPGTFKLKLSQECVPWIARRAAPRVWADEPTILYANRQAWPERTLEWRRLNAPEGGEDAMLGGDPAAVAGALQAGAGADDEEPLPEEEVVGGAVEEAPPAGAEAEEAEEAAAAARLGFEPMDEPMSEEEQAALEAIADAADAEADARAQAAAEALVDAEDAAAAQAGAAAAAPINLIDDDVEPPVVAPAPQPEPEPPAPAIERAAVADFQDEAAARRAQLRAAAEARLRGN
jgi:hypothetical protein